MEFKEFWAVLGGIAIFFILLSILKVSKKTTSKKNPSEAENKAKAFVQKKHFRTQQILFNSVQNKDNTWLMKEELRFKWAIFFVIKRSFSLQMRPEIGEVESYKEFKDRPSGCDKEKKYFTICVQFSLR